MELTWLVLGTKSGPNCSLSSLKAHLTLLRFFCALLDAASAESPAVLSSVLKAAETRYVLYLDLLLSLNEDDPLKSLPLPPW
jgi:hypothetical protein